MYILILKINIENYIESVYIYIIEGVIYIYNNKEDVLGIHYHIFTRFITYLKHKGYLYNSFYLFFHAYNSLLCFEH